ncbi:ceb55052-9488-41d7-bf4f-653d39a82bb0 [Sclerotinia trifoliorum]|uniref:Ceb55052-9488-41d7-bf4f-653d39a82bb0 n=1 Tax=Sclerotinia trifoliorum TaxID=28548 RepID=A0A8H2ZVL6_9HELO|nr:ceb55052-9488-41d7-bf4f-653d39a82bb0 [Sclerotinia trifoliorum]
MPFCPLNVSELPVTTLGPSPRVVDVNKYIESRPDVYIARKTMAPLDAVVTCLWLIDPRILHQFLNRRLPLFIFQIKRNDSEDANMRWETSIMRQKISNSLHIILLEVTLWEMDEHEKWNPITTKLHYITDGHILRFELHDENSTQMEDEIPMSPTKANPESRLNNLTQVEKVLLYITTSIIENECGIDPPEGDPPKYSFIWDRKWKKPENMIICPRIYSRDSKPLIDHYEEEYLKSRETAMKALSVFDVRLLPLSRRCICEAPAVKFSIDMMEIDNVKMKMKSFVKSEDDFRYKGGVYHCTRLRALA